MRRSIVLLAATVLLSSLLSCVTHPRFDSAGACGRLFAAWQQRDEQTVRDLLADDVRWEILGQTYVGKDEVLQFMRFDAAQGSRVELTKAEAKGDTVRFELLESNDTMSAFGVSQIRNFGRMIFQEGKIRRIDDVRPPEGAQAIEAAWPAFAAWLQAQHPDAMSKLISADGKPVISAEAGQALVALAREWRSTSSPKLDAGGPATTSP